jgi:hypothetical protein
MRVECARGYSSSADARAAFSIASSGSTVVDASVVALLDRLGVRFSLIGGVALGAHGFARYTADVDLLTMDGRVLAEEFWTGSTLPEIHRGDPDDPLAGLVRWDLDPTHDLLVGRGHAMQLAVDSAAADATLGCRVATPLALVLLKLEAGGPQDRNDILSLVDAQRTLGSAAWLSEVASHLGRLSAPARAAWERVRGDLGLA